MEQRRFPPQKRRRPEGREAVKKCKITIKKRKDGSLVKEISGECSKEQLKALSDQQININEGVEDGKA